MYFAEEKRLYTSVDQQILSSQYQLITLYTNNLCTVAIQASVIAGLSYAALNNIYEMSIVSNSILAYGYHAAYTISLVCSLLVTAQATVASMFGPKKALLANSKEAVYMSSKYMRNVQSSVLRYGGVAIALLFIGSILQAFDSVVTPLACILFVIFCFGFYILYTHSIESYQAQQSHGSASTDNQSIQARYRQSNVIFDLDSSSHGLEEPGLQSALQGYDSLSSAIKRLHKQLVENVSSHG